MSKNYAIITQFVLPLMTFYRSGAQESNVYKRDAFVTSWRFHNRTWQPQRHDRLSETSGTLWIHRGALTNQRCSLATGCGIKLRLYSANPRPGYWSNLPCDWPSTAWAYSELETENGPCSSSQTWLSSPKICRALWCARPHQWRGG